MGVTKRKFNDLKSEYILKGLNSFQKQQRQNENKENSPVSGLSLAGDSAGKRKKSNDLYDPLTGNYNIPVKRKITYLGVVKTDPNEYVRNYGNCLIKSEELPEFIKSIPNPTGIELAANKPQTVHTPSVESEIIKAIETKTIEIRSPSPKPPITSLKTETSDFKDLTFSKDQIDFILSYLDRQISYEFNTKKIRI